MVRTVPPVTLKELFPYRLPDSPTTVSPPTVPPVTEPFTTIAWSSMRAVPPADPPERIFAYGPTYTVDGVLAGAQPPPLAWRTVPLGQASMVPFWNPWGQALASSIMYG